jgi:hypothetical protein
MARNTEKNTERQRTEGEGRAGEHTHQPTVHAHDHYHISHHTAGDSGDQVEHRVYWHTHEHNHNELTHSHDYSQTDEERHHGREAHIHDHSSPADSPG